MESDPRIQRALEALRQLRDAMQAIATAGPDMPTSAVRAVANLGAMHADQVIAELSL